MTRGDRIVIAIVAVLAAAAWPLSALAGAGRSDTAVITGPLGTSEVRIGEPRRLTVEGLRGRVSLVIDDDSVRIVESSCPDKLCVERGAIDAPGSTIVCAPNAVTVRIGGDADALDAHVR